MHRAVLALAHVLAAVSYVQAATTTVSCDAEVAVAIKTVDATKDGSSVACCADRSSHCSLSANGVCEPSDAAAWCISASGERACTITYTNATGAPCGTTISASATTGSLPYGVTPLGSAYLIPLLPAATTVALANWLYLSSRSEAALCFSTDGAARTTQITTLQTRTCAANEYMLVCHGATKRGLCTAYSNDATIHELGQFYGVSLEGTPPTSASTTSQETTSSEPQQTLVVNTGVPRWMLAVVAVVCILGTALLCALGVLVVYMRRRNVPTSPPELETTTPFVEASIVSPVSWHSGREVVSGKRSRVQTGEAALPPYSEPASRSTVATV